MLTLTERRKIVSTFNIIELALGSVQNRCNITAIDQIGVFESGKDNYRSYFSFREEVKEYAHSEIKNAEGGVIKRKNSLSKYPGEVAADYLLVDIDYKQKPGFAQVIAKDFISDLEERHKVDRLHIRVFFSGNKGFHVVLPSYLFNEFCPARNLPEIHKRMVNKLTEDVREKHKDMFAKAETAVIDYSIYKTIGLIRMNNTINSKSGLYKIELSVDELFSLSFSEIKALAKQPRKLQREYIRVEVNPALHYLYEDTRIRSVSDNSKNIKDFDSDVLASYDYSKVKNTDMTSFENMKGQCEWLQKVIEQSERGENIINADRVSLAILLKSFGVEGQKKTHEILSRTPNYDQQKTEYHLNNILEGDYNYPACSRLCPEGMCSNMLARGKKSPIVFAHAPEEKEYPFELFNESKVVEHFIRNNPEFKYSLDDDAFYLYKNGVYSKMSNIEALTFLNTFMEDVVQPTEVTERRIKGILERLRIYGAVALKGEFNTEKYIINLKNGIYDLRTGVLSEHTPSLLTSIQLNFGYNSEATAPNFIRFLEEIFENDQQTINFILDTMCYFLIPDYSFQKVFIFLGAGRNGKGVLSSIIRELVGQVNTSGLSMHEIANKGFAAIHLKDKLLNISSEIDSQELSMSMIKRLSGGDVISADRKFKEMDMFINKAKLLILANQLPRFSEISTAVLERFVMVRFPKTFTNEEVNTSLFEDLKTELPGIFNLVASRFSRIAEGGGIRYEIPETIQNNKKIFLSEVSSVAEFITGECTVTDGYRYISVKYLYNRYVRYCESCNYKPRGYKNFISDIEGPLGLKTGKREEGKVVYGLTDNGSFNVKS